MEIQVKGTSLPRALHCWDRSLQENLHVNGSHGNPSHLKHKTPPMRGCPLHLIDSCPWPHCNPSCPTIRDQLTGQEMNAIQFLKHMGFDVQKMAQQQGMDPQRLLGMLNNGNWVTFDFNDSKPFCRDEKVIRIKNDNRKMSTKLSWEKCWFFC